MFNAKMRRADASAGGAGLSVVEQRPYGDGGTEGLTQG